MRRQGAKNRHSNARTLTETRTRELSGQKSAQKRPIWRRIGNVWFARAGWWCVQSHTNRSPTQNSLLRAILQGILRKIRGFAQQRLSVAQSFQTLGRKFPRKLAGNFFELAGKQQGMLLRNQGICSGVISSLEQARFGDRSLWNIVPAVRDTTDSPPRFSLAQRPM